MVFNIFYDSESHISISNIIAFLSALVALFGPYLYRVYDREREKSILPKW